MRRLRRILPKKSGRSQGVVTVRHQGGRNKRFLRKIDFDRREKIGISGRIESIEVYPNRSAWIAKVVYTDVDRRYIISSNGLTIGQKVVSGDNAPLEIGNALRLGKIAVGTQIHNIEIRPGKSAQIVKSAGSVAVLQGKEETYVLVKFPS